ncbi:HU family DNA-binding protein [Bacteroides sp. BFG-257]|uniref:HU family DNA-binding protein n=1 Tax=Bacteroides TaxID=816 RepID=UPI001CCC0DA0|nr:MULTISPECIES: HU family DNA-binding protein [Bacteroides]UBD68436.1 HU family DNA-binding protein [Bacteroides cellulosilyticus]UVO97104.1 HU family DNA-binding protein [Bacteroides sp. BFG-257]
MNEKLNIQNLIELLAEKHGMDKADAESFVKEFFQLIEESLENDKYVKIRGLGTFKLIDVESRESVNINTGERFEIQGHTKVSFAPEPALKDLINKPFSHFETVVLNDETVLEDAPVEDNSEEEEKEEVFVEVVEVPTEVIEETAEIVKEESVVVAEEHIQVVEEVIETTEQPVREKEIQVDQTEPVIQIEESEQFVEAPVVLSGEVKQPVTEVITPVDECVEEPLTEQKDQEDLVPTYEVPEPPSPPVNKADSSTMKFFIGIVVLVVLLCVGAVTFMYYPDLFDRISPPPTEKVADEKVEKPAAPVALTDSIVRKDTATVVAKKDTVAEVVTPKVVEEPKPVAKQETPATAPKKETKKAAATPFEPDSVNYKIVGTKATYTIQEGETLTKVALRFYGTKALWPYIVKYNSGVIKNPDHVPYGTVIKIPELEKK